MQVDVRYRLTAVVAGVHDQAPAGLGYAFPESAPKALKKSARVAALHDAVFARPRIARYLTSGRRLPFNNDDLFRRYDELTP